MEKEKNNKGVVALLAVLVVALSVVCVLFATGIISFKNSNTNDDNGNNSVTQDDNKDNNQVIQNNDIDINKLDAIYDILGIDKNETQSLKHCLNYNLSANDYLKNSKKIFSLYAMIHEYTMNGSISLEERQKIMYCDVVKSEDCSSQQPFLSAAAARVISQPRAKEIITKYNLQDTDFLMDFPHVANFVDDMYGYYTEYASGGVCNYIIKHNLDVQENEMQGVTVIDKQTVIELKYDQEKMGYIKDNESNQIVTYNLRSEYDTYHYVYYLDSVSVK